MNGFFDFEIGARLSMVQSVPEHMLASSLASDAGFVVTALQRAR